MTAHSAFLLNPYPVLHDGQQDVADNGGRRHGEHEFNATGDPGAQSEPASRSK